MNSAPPKLEWEEKYNVGVAKIDGQHQKMFMVINNLIDTIKTTPTQEQLSPIMTSLIEYKKFHFDTEEKYFKKFNYSKTEEHITAHRQFNERLQVIQEKNQNDAISLAYELIDFLEDWLIDHLLTVDQEYKGCFLSHGLK